MPSTLAGRDRDQLAIVIPARDEAPTISAIVEAAQAYAAQVIVIDGHSKDATAELARKAGAEVHFDGGKGKGEAIRCSIEHVRAPIVVFMDADGSHDPKDIPALVAPILDGSADHVTGSRLLGGSSELHGGFDEWLRLAGSSFITACINKKHGVRLSDSQNGFRAIRTEVLRALGLRENITTIEQEMILRTLQLGYRMAETPTHEHARKAGVSKIRLGKVWLRYGMSLTKGLLARRGKGSKKGSEEGTGG